ncbi:hypothetical protein BT67DRAFT_304233 [Trichocladium antarcticum]|uniref:F-box domain-containing protein n=1 Tax=Trichocladium antarcticum TaxID=1450529 RepID=A0AAN6ZE07_9PEZI|nr:hypothetical protein BT67DRAFT_304233 [Trichocladium antarcticum]
MIIKRCLVFSRIPTEATNCMVSHSNSPSHHPSPLLQMAPNTTTIDTLPNELLQSILSQLPATALLALLPVSRRFHAATQRILQQRLRRATAQPEYRLILECYHPSAKLSTPYLSCTHQHTDRFDSAAAAPTGTGATPTGLRGAYAHFRPAVQDENRRGRARYPRRLRRRRRRRRRRRQPPSDGSGGEDGASSGQAAGPLMLLSEEEEAEEEEEDGEVEEGLGALAEPRPSQDIYLAPGELVSPLCTVTNLVRVGPRAGLFVRHVNVGDGVIGASRGWLAARAAADGARDRGGGGAEDAVLWADAARTVGVRFRVAERDIRGEHPVLVAGDEELPVTYRLEFEELLVRAAPLLIMVERSEVQEVAPEGTAIVIAV